jgi:hypothetical protein
MIPLELYNEIKKDNCVIFAGAGISTEGGVYGKPSFYEIIKKESEYPVSKKDLSFPELMQYYCDKKDGGKKNLLIRKIIDRIEFFSQSGEVNISATLTHHEIAQNPFFKIIVTTNWDPFFERKLNILVPMVEDRDIPFWDDKKRQVLKIHGCVTRPYTMIITQNDYKNLVINEKNTPVFTKLKDLMATKTFLFVGYSMQDPNIKIIFKDLSKSLGEFSRLSYAVDPTPNRRTIAEWKRHGVQIIKTNGIRFFRDINDRLVSEKLIPNPELVDFYSDQFNRISQIHSEDSKNQEEKFLSTMYQDGMCHEFSYILASSRYGIKITDLKDRLKKWRGILRKYERDEEKYKNAETEKEKKCHMNVIIEIAYWTGRIDILSRFLRGKRQPIQSDF